jgi:hypothetical protein
MKHHHTQAVRAFNRIWEPISESIELAADADAGFDAGEWSGDHHAKRLADEFYRVMELVAGRFGLTRQELHAELEFYAHFEFGCLLEARQ